MVLGDTRVADLENCHILWPSLVSNKNIRMLITLISLRNNTDGIG